MELAGLEPATSWVRSSIWGPRSSLRVANRQWLRAMRLWLKPAARRRSDADVPVWYPRSAWAGSTSAGCPCCLGDCSEPGDHREFPSGRRRQKHSPVPRIIAAFVLATIRTRPWTHTGGPTSSGSLLSALGRPHVVSLAEQQAASWRGAIVRRHGYASDADPCSVAIAAIRSGADRTTKAIVRAGRDTLLSAPARERSGRAGRDQIRKAQRAVGSGITTPDRASL